MDAHGNGMPCSAPPRGDMQAACQKNGNTLLWRCSNVNLVEIRKGREKYGDF
ncbi:MAG: hypothetical protein K2O03_07640 [Lachnospiraceae bacterium]|nr:hypothetical protein [Lachnospiraceae bacterium]